MIKWNDHASTTFLPQDLLQAQISTQSPVRLRRQRHLQGHEVGSLD
jgi:hypothetical protein